MFNPSVCGTKTDERSDLMNPLQLRDLAGWELSSGMNSANFQDLLPIRLDIMSCMPTDQRSIEISADQQYSRVFSSLQCLQSHGQLCDIEIFMRKGTIVAHKVILAAAIPFFKTMFTGNKEEARSHRISIRSSIYCCEVDTYLVVLGIDHNILKQLISHVYGHSLVVSEGNVEAMLLAADFLQLRHISDICSIFILDYVLDCENALGIREFLSTVGYRNHLNVDEEDIFTAAARWIEYYPARIKVAFRSQRRRNLCRVLSCVRLRLLKKDFLVNVVARHQIPYKLRLMK
ncbi:BTB/POZ domain protein [Necator americanus]|uniref:BTB/POZ domain protein n=1 Tax=Necator americanus TaxID=51031 RepID=W2SWD7_NECAM|nr:BTB/POZ domain protein [Necator americanus]ETN74074.1 BTB/POZ domain protein [Necator americanus]